MSNAVSGRVDIMGQSDPSEMIVVFNEYRCPLQSGVQSGHGNVVEETQ